MLQRLLIVLGVCVVALAPGTAYGARTLLVTEQDTGTLGAFDLSRDGAPTPFAAGPVASGDDAGGVTISPDARFAFVANTAANTVRPFAIGDDRTLTPVSAAIASGGTQPSALTVTPNGRRLLVAHRSGQDVSVFDIDQTTGALTPAALAQNVGFDDVTAVAVSRDGRFVYASGRGPSGPPASNADTRLGFLAINSNGTLSPIGGSPQQFAGDIGGFGIAIAPDGARLFLTLANGSKIRVFTLNETTGVPSSVAGSPFAAGAAVQQALLSPDGRRLYAHDVFGTAVVGYDLNPATGAPTAITGSPFGLGAFNQPAGVAIAPDARSLYAAISFNPSKVAGFSIGATGALTALTGSPFAGPGSFSSFYSAAITPTQTPVATLAVAQGEPGKPSAFSATASARGGFVTRYDWDFGDGTALADGGPAPSHVYAAAGNYTAKLTVTNDCDPAAVFENGSVYTGRTTYCNGARTATVERPVVVSVPAPPPASPPATPAPVNTALATFTATRAFTLPSTRSCLKRPPRLTLVARRPKGVTVDRVEVRLAGKRIARRTGKDARKSITLRKLPTKTFTLTISVTPRGGKAVTTKRTYKVCKPAGKRR